MVNETYKDIKGYEGYYQVSNFGNVRSLDREVIRSDGNFQFHHGKILKLSDNGSGYLVAQLCKDSVVKGYLVHRLVASEFIPNRENLPVVNHKDGNTKNNKTNNLEWCTQSYNIIHGLSLHPRTTDRTNLMKAISKEVYCPETDTTYKSITEASRILKVSSDYIRSAILWRGKKARTATNGSKYRFFSSKKEYEKLFLEETEEFMQFENGRNCIEVRTGKVYQSLHDFCSATDSSESTVRGSIINLRGYVPKLDMMLIDIGYEKTFYISEEDKKCILNRGRINAIRKRANRFVVCETTGEIYPNPSAASLMLGLPISCVSEVMSNGGHYKKLDLKFSFIDSSKIADSEILNMFPHFKKVFMSSSGGRK